MPPPRHGAATKYSKSQLQTIIFREFSAGLLLMITTRTRNSQSPMSAPGTMGKPRLSAAALLTIS